MDDSSIESALDRIDHALARIERETARADHDTRDLQDRHARLKASVSQTLGDLDALIAETRR